MNNYTKLERLIFAMPEWKKMTLDAVKKMIKLGKAKSEDDYLEKEKEKSKISEELKRKKQEFLDTACEEIIIQMTNDELLQSTVQVYEDTAQEYKKNPHTRYVIDDLIRFMMDSRLPNNGQVLDIGCGHGRDSLFMFYADPEFRKSHMQRITNGRTTMDKFAIPQKKFKIVGIDGSPKMLEIAKEKSLFLKGTFLYSNQPLFICHDIHNIRLAHLMTFDAVWSCASLLTHTPRNMVEATIESISELIKPGGLFYISYTNGLADGKYNKLILSSTGRIKWFSQPDPNKIIAIARKYGLVEVMKFKTDDYVKGNDFKKDLFVSHLFQKVK